jgi:hypothetical protein
MDTDRRPPGADARTVRALRELALFIESNPTSGCDMVASILKDLDEILNDEVLQSQIEMFELAAFKPIPKGDDTFMLRLKPAYMHIKKLYQLQQARLREAIAQAVLGHLQKPQ